MIKDLIYDKNIAFVGPSDYLNDKELGKIIDENDIIIKLNHFETLPIIHYGSRADIVCCNFHRDLIPHEDVEKHKTKLIMSSHPLEGELLDNLNMRHIKQNIRTFHKSKDETYEKIPHELYPWKDLEPYYVRLLSKKWNTSGFWMMCLLFSHLKNIKTLNIYGIDFCFRKYSKEYCNGLGKIANHDMRYELTAFKEMYSNEKHLNKINIIDKDFEDYLNK